MPGPVVAHIGGAQRASHRIHFATHPRPGFTALPPERIEPLIREVRGVKVILDTDLARVYGVTTKALNQAAKRNSGRFPDDFVFRLSPEEYEANRSQNVTGSQKHRDPRLLPYAFTEHGAIMAANVLNSSCAVQMSVFVVRAFLKMRAMLADTRELSRKLAALERELKDRLDAHEAAIVTILQRVMDIIDPAPRPPLPAKPKIGFRVKEKRGRYKIAAKRLS